MNDLKSLIEVIANAAATKAAQCVMGQRPIPRRYFSTKEVSVYLGLSVDVLQLWRAQGKGPMYLQVHRSIRYDVQAVDAWIAGFAPGLDGAFVDRHENERTQDQLEDTR